MGPDTTMFRVEGARLLQVFSAYLGIDTTTGSCPAAMSAQAPDLLVASRRQASRAASIAALSAGVPRWSLNVPHGIANARVPNWKRPPPAPSVPRPRCRTRSLRGTQSPPAARASEARCQKVMLLNTSTMCAVPRCRWSTTLLDSEPPSPGIRSSRCGM